MSVRHDRPGAGTDGATGSGPAFVLVHGAGLGAFVWESVREALGRPTLAVDLPHRKGDPRGLGLADYVDHVVRETERSTTRDLILVGHSVAGLVAQQAARDLDGRVRGLVGVGAAFARPGGSFAGSLPIPQRWVLPLAMRLAGTRPPERLIRSSLCRGLPGAAADEIVSRFTAESRRLFTDRVAGSPPPVPSLALVLTNDTEIRPDLQRRAAETLYRPRVAELATGHLPMIETPGALAEALERFAAALPARTEGTTP